MRYHDIALHGIEEATPQPDGSACLQRVPENVRARLEPPAQEKTLFEAGAELRYVLCGPTDRITLFAESNHDLPPTTCVFFGPLVGRPHIYLIGTDPTTIDISIGDDQRSAYGSFRKIWRPQCRTTH